ncbi:uncharacterized protein LOC129244998 [Anastrepha obliqua]|uniref:uncharacterized protein LOC128866297 n=1 Tax=Anastrepha ludens TaxID=28586 RepID=UPI0023AF201A|nr:uncharacterized protein LOC128866297 [Anastrepha ludens]XP_053962880.1 uncharacterized protein LOC128866297 [Anastrepha ludens]XP_053962881.1 uncharacterized protein LOC128866297 [Anastrepha ludens]XP_053962882.1 uncharacterized protein LOC128866297 [Anastrepha ludens]XP_054738913.1 uncharacterized protein LOC129244998 [Anastrepha obliqua]XP_054738914.1 uncharacterized protein LOC129244998 [Anastrepha obliqua]
MTTLFHMIFWLYLLGIALKTRFALGYDPNDTKIASVIPPEGYFEAFYPREMDGVPNSASRPAHAHGSFFKHRNPALVDTKNAAAYGYRFDGKRRFNLK